MPMNPYQPPFGEPGVRPAGLPNCEVAKQRLLTPAIVLLVMAALSICWLILSLVVNLVTIEIGRDPDAMGGLAFHIAFHILAFLSNGFMIVGSRMMMRLDSLTAARVAAIISLIPLCSPCFVLGIPFGIWALVVMSDPSVRACFRS